MGNELGKILEELRDGVSLREASKRSGLSHTYIRDLELGVNRQNGAPIKPSIDVLNTLAQAYNFPLEVILVKAGYINPSNLDKYVEEIQQVIKELGINDLEDFLSKWENLTPYEIELIKRHLQMVMDLSKENQTKKEG